MKLLKAGPVKREEKFFHRIVLTVNNGRLIVQSQVWLSVDSRATFANAVEFDDMVAAEGLFWERVKRMTRKANVVRDFQHPELLPLLRRLEHEDKQREC